MVRLCFVLARRPKTMSRERRQALTTLVRLRAMKGEASVGSLLVEIALFLCQTKSHQLGSLLNVLRPERGSDEGKKTKKEKNKTEIK